MIRHNANLSQLMWRKGPPVPNDVKLDDAAEDFLNVKCLALDPKDRPTALELLKHPFITVTDENWTFKDSKIGRNVASMAPRTISQAGTTATGSSTLRPKYI